MNRGDKIFYAVVLLGISAWLGWCLWDRQVRHDVAELCKARGGQYINVGFETYGCYKLTEIK